MSGAVRRRIAALGALSALLAGATATAKTGDARASVEPWSPARIASDQFESHPAFDPRNSDLYFVRSRPDFTGWRILMSHCGADGWSVPVEPSFAGNGVEADPWFSADGGSLYFISSRSGGPKSATAPRKDLDLWRVDRDRDGHWRTPQRLPEPVNSKGAEWFPRPAPDGWLYFGSTGRPGGLGMTDIWRARQDRRGAWTVENLGPNINTPGDEYEPLVSADGKRMVLMAGDGLYESTRTASGWSPRKKLGPQINVNGSEIGALLSPDGHSMLFARDLKNAQSGELFLWRDGRGDADWPPRCPHVAARPAHGG
ncbi:TolB family protein [Pseudomonas sp. CGJS7]|uniref:TolB family protein n=1 Tax=Pseudomonas sp. CGJS7 TaxID=3109348 RepID=UPI0030081DC7